MVKTFRKFVLPMAFVFLAQTVVPIPVLGAEAQTVKMMAPAKTEISLEQAITIVKQNFTVPTEFSQFSSGFNNYNNRQTWSLNWTKPEPGGGSFSAQVDVSNGEILSMNQWKNVPQPESGFNLPQVSYAEAKEKAQQLVNKLLAARLDELVFVPEDSQIISLSHYGPVTYSFRWKRSVHGIPFPSNTVTIQVNGRDGEVTGYNVNWSLADFPEAQGVIGEPKANQSFRDHKMLEMQYYVPPMIRPLAAHTKSQARLVYQLSPQSNNAMIDALTGEPVKLENGQWLAEESMADNRGGYGGAGKGDIQQPVLTPEEQKEVEKTAQSITQERAVECVKQWIPVPDSLILRSANLGMDGSYGQNRVWSLNWNSDQTSKENMQYLYARVDAMSGELLAFNLSPKAGSSDEKAAIDRASAQKLVEEFLKKIQPQHFQEVKLVENLTGPYKGMGDDATSYGFNYQRVVDGVLFPNNGINVMIDARTQTITNYNLNWWTVEFPAPSEGMAQKSAEDQFLEARPLELKYVQMSTPSGLGEIRLVYQPSFTNVLARSNVMDAKTGQFLDWQGQPLAEQPHPYTFKDISGNFAEKEISLLGQAGIFGENGDQFKPNEPLTVGSILKAMIIAKNGAWQNINLKDEEVLQKAKEFGWWQEDLAAASGVSRELMAKLQIRLLGFEKVAQLPNMFQSPYEDVKTDHEAVGYISLVKGFELMKSDGTNFEPDRNMTRAEGAYALVKTLEVKR